MLVEALRLLLVLVLLVLLPGWLLVHAAFPRRAFRGAERAYLVAAGGVLTLMLVATLLGLLPPLGEKGWYTMLTTGFPMVELAMMAACLLLFWIGLVRGAYPRVAARYPRLLAPEAKGLVGR